jgi:hypothetical protein
MITILINTIDLDYYNVKIYGLESQSNNWLTQKEIDTLYNELNIQEYPKGIVEILEVKPGIIKIEVYSKSGDLLVSSGILLE